MKTLLAGLIIDILERNLNDQMQTNINVLHKSIDIILFLGRQGLALRSSVDFSKPQEVNKGNFVAMLSLLSKTDTRLREHLTRAPKKCFIYI